MLILAIIEEAETALDCLNAAAEAAEINPGSKLIGLHIRVDSKQLMAAPEEISIQSHREEKEGSPQSRSDRARRMFNWWLSSSSMSAQLAEWRERVGSVEHLLAAEAKEANLVVISQPHNMDSEDALHSAIFNSGKLVLFVPKRSQGAPKLWRHIAIAWKPRPHARKAIKHSLPWLRSAQRITVITVDESNDRDSFELVDLLKAEGIVAEIRRIKTTRGEHIADRLLSEARAENAGSLVMGAYRFGEIIEWVLGGVTHEVLMKADIPIFLMH